MSLLKGATRRLLLQRPYLLSVPKQGYKVDNDYISIIDFIKDQCKIQQDTYQQIHELVKDESILKRYFSNEIIEELNYLPFIQLGIEFLLEHAEFEDAQKGRIILEKLLTRIGKELPNDKT